MDIIELLKKAYIQGSWNEADKELNHSFDDFLKENKEAINYSLCCTELNPDFAIGEQVLLTKRTVVTIDTFCEDGMIGIDDNNEYYKVDKDELTKRV